MSGAEAFLFLDVDTGAFKRGRWMRDDGGGGGGGDDNDDDEKAGLSAAEIRSQDCNLLQCAFNFSLYHRSYDVALNRHHRSVVSRSDSQGSLG